MQKTKPADTRNVHKLVNFCNWILGILLCILGFLVALNSVAASLIFLAAAALVLPKTSGWMTARIPALRYRWLKTLTLLYLLWTAFVLLDEAQGLKGAGGYATYIGLIALFAGSMKPGLVRAFFFQEPNRLRIWKWFGSFTLVALVLNMFAAGAVPNTFSYNYTEEELMDSLVSESLESMVETGPLYFGSAPSYEPYTRYYEIKRVEKVHEILRDSDKALAGLEKLNETMNTLRPLAVSLLGVTIETEIDNDLKKSLLQKMYKGGAFSDRSISALSTAQGYSRSLAGTESQLHEPALARANFERVMAVWYAAHAAMEEWFYLNTTMASVSTIYGISEQKAYTEISSAIDTIYGDASDEVQQQFIELLRYIGKVDQGFGQLHSADLLFVEQTISEMDRQLPLIDETLRSPLVHERLSLEEIKMLRSYVHSLDALRQMMRLGYEKQPAEITFISTDRFTFESGMVRAGFGTNLWNALSKTSTRAYDLTARTVNLGYRTAKNTAWAARKGLQHTANALEVVRNTVVDTATMKDNSINPFRHFYSNINDAHERFNKGQLGKQTFEGALEVFEQVENTADYLVGKGLGEQIRSVRGKESYVAMAADGLMWIPGKTAKLATSMLTGLGKGVAMIGSPESTTGDITAGSLEIASAFVGGSGNFFKGTEMLHLFKTSRIGSLLHTKAAQYGKKLIDSLPSLPASVISTGVREGIEEASKKAVTVNYSGVIGEAAETLAVNILHLPTSMKEKWALAFAHGKGLENFFRLWSGKAGGNTAGGYFNQFFEEEADNVFQDLAKAVVDYYAEPAHVSEWSEPLQPTTFDPDWMTKVELFELSPPVQTKKIQPALPAPATKKTIPPPTPVAPAPSRAQENMKRDCQNNGGTWTSGGTCYLPEATKEKTPEPEPAPPSPSSPAPAPVAPVDACTGMTGCEACWCKGQACVCGLDSCHCE